MSFIVVVKKTLRYSTVFFYSHLYPNSLFRNIIMESGIKIRIAFFVISSLNHKASPNEIIKNSPASVISTIAPSMSPVIHPIRFL